MKNYKFKDNNEKILFSYNMNNNNEISSIFENEVIIDTKKADEETLEIFGKDNWYIKYIFSQLNMPIILARYFAGNYIYQGSYFTEDIKDRKYNNTTYSVFNKKKIENFLLEKGYSSELIKCIIGFYKEYLPTDVFCSSDMKDIRVTSNNDCIIKIEFKIDNLQFVDNSKRYYNNIENFVRYRFWGNATLNGKLIKLNEREFV